MISIFPELEIARATTDSNIDTPQSRVRANAFDECNNLLAECREHIEVVIEGRLYDRVSPRLNDAHKNAFETNYEINRSAVDVHEYDITKAIKFITLKQKLELKKGKVIVITENTSNYSELCSDSRFKAYSSKEFIERTTKFKKIKEDYDTLNGALITAFFVD